MHKGWLLAPAFVFGGIGFSISGLPPAVEAVVSNYVTPLVDPLVGQFVAHPKALFFFIGLFVGVILLPLVFRWRRLSSDYAAFIQRRDASHKEARRKFSRLLDLAYAKWRGSTDAYPETIDTLTDQSKPPHSRRFVSSVTDDVRIALQEANWALWNFCDDLYREIMLAQRQRGFKPTLLETTQEYEEFSDARRTLSEFWNVEAMRIYRSEGRIFRTVWLHLLGPHLRQERLFRQLPFLEVALARRLDHKQLGHPHLFRLSLRAMSMKR
ncbi:MAG: hypothetical protein AB7S71_09500 [Dongiaceae bacterium]